MNRRWEKESIGRTVGATLLLGETHHRMVQRPEKYNASEQLRASLRKFENFFSTG
jgi:hypothetical protein